MEGNERSDGVRIFIVEKWMDSVVSVKRCNERVQILTVVLMVYEMSYGIYSSPGETGGGKREFLE